MTATVTIMNNGRSIHDGNSGITGAVSVFGSIKKGTKLTLGNLKSFL